MKNNIGNEMKSFNQQLFSMSIDDLNLSFERSMLQRLAGT